MTNQYGTVESGGPTMTLNDYRVSGYTTEAKSPSTGSLIVASGLVLGVLAVDADVFFDSLSTKTPATASTSTSTAPGKVSTPPPTASAPAAPPQPARRSPLATPAPAAQG